MKDFFIAMKFYFRILFLLCFFLMSCAQKEKQVKVPKAVRGLLDLSSLSIEEDTVVSLSGEWEFYWKQFCQPNYPHKKGELQCSSDKAAQLPVFLPLPSEWQNYGFPVRGFGTYRLRIILPKTYPSLSLFMTDVGTAYVIYLNGKLISSNGVPAKTRSESKPYMKHRYFDINSYLNHHRVGEEIELLIHVSNFHYANAGIWDKIQLISRKGEKKSRIHKMILDIVVFSSILIMGLYHLGLFFSRRKDYSPLYFGIFCILIALRTVSISERYILDVFPYMPFPLVHKIEYISFYYGCLTFLQFSRALFPVECPKKVYRLFFLTIVPFILSVIFLDMQAYTGTLQYMQIILLLEIIFLIYMITLAVLHKRLGAKLLSLGWLFFSIAIINDLLKSRSLVFTPYLSSYGLLILIVFQATVISRRFAYSFEQTEKLSFALKHKSDRLEETALELKKLTENLELKVQERTKDLEDSKSEIETLNQFTSLINSHSDLNVIFIEISKYVYEKFHITASCLLLPDENGENLQTFKAFSYDKLSEQKYQKL
ncbi:MAG: hypothetical protein KDK45_23835, partial [Leptospiraceae bacterium]|nr:hypothetical protein [Leptospiraceae bacterium]